MAGGRSLEESHRPNNLGAGATEPKSVRIVTAGTPPEEKNG